MTSTPASILQFSTIGNHGAAPLDDSGAAETIYHEPHGPGLAVQPGEHGEIRNTMVNAISPAMTKISKLMF
jgi:hypothetical protein